MTTTLFVTLDPPPGALEADDPLAFTVDYVARCLAVHGVHVHRVDTSLPWDPLAVDEALADTASHELHECSHDGCGETFTAPHHLKLHERGHKTATCPYCGHVYGLAGMSSHKKACPKRPVEEQRVEPPPPRRPELEPQPSSEPLMPTLGPIERRPFDPERARAAAMGGVW